MARGFKTGGRQAGTPNKVTKEIRELITQFISDKWQGIQIDFDTLEPKDRIMFYERLLQYVIPKLKAEPFETIEEKQPSKLPSWMIDPFTKEN